MTPSPSRLQRLWTALGPLLLALAVFGALLWAPRHEDDRTQLAWLLHLSPTTRAPWDLYAWVRPGDHPLAHPGGYFPWWFPDGPTTGVFRPLASLSIWFDVHALGGLARAAHVHSFAWLVALALAAARFFRATLHREGPVRVALFALLTSAPLVVDLGWLCNRCAIMSTAFGLLAFERLAYWARLARPRDVALAVASWLLALACGEYAFALLPLVLLAVVGSDRTAVRRGALGALGLAALAVAWYAAIKAAGYGGADMDAAIDPWTSPTHFVARLPARVPRLVGRWLVASLSSRLARLDGVALLALLVVLASTVVALLRKPRRWSLAPWLVAFAGACVVLSAALQQVRVMLPAMVACAGALATLWADDGRAGAAAWLRRAAIVALIGHQAFVSWLSAWQHTWRERARAGELIASGRRLTRGGARRFLVVTSGEPELLANPARAWVPARIPAPEAWVVAGLVEAPLLAVRVSERAVLIRAVERTPVLPALWRGRSPQDVVAPVRVGEVTVQPRVLVGGAPTEVLVTFPADPEALGWTLVAAHGTRLDALPFPVLHGAVTLRRMSLNPVSLPARPQSASRATSSRFPPSYRCTRPVLVPTATVSV